MKNMNGQAGNSNLTFTDDELGLINEYINEQDNSMRIGPKLLDSVTISNEPSTRGIQLVPRGSAPCASNLLTPGNSFMPSVSSNMAASPVSPAHNIRRRQAQGKPSTPQLMSRSSAPVATPESRRSSGGLRGSNRQGQLAVMAADAPGADPNTRFLEDFLEQPKLVITEQPKQRGMRFRYECEGRSAGSILGESTNEHSKTLPTIEVQGHTQAIKKVKVTVSLVSKEIPYRPHPHSLVGKDCNEGICVVNINTQSNRKHSFSNLGIQCVRRKEVDAALEKRRKQGIDPFNTGQTKSIEDVEMNVVRLCFQAEAIYNSGDRRSLPAIVSEPIYDKKATTTSELKINRLNIVRGPCSGKTEIYLLCDKVQKDDIEIIFCLDDWEAKGEFAQTDVHRQIAIVFKSPPYQDLNITEEVEVNVVLRRVSDHMDSEPVKYTYLPQDPDPYDVKRKRKRPQPHFKMEMDDQHADLSLTLPENSLFPSWPMDNQSMDPHADSAFMDPYPNYQFADSDPYQDAGYQNFTSMSQALAGEETACLNTANSENTMNSTAEALSFSLTRLEPPVGDLMDNGYMMPPVFPNLLSSVHTIKQEHTANLAFGDLTKI
ncbi:transcription factor RelB isoform X1 [Polypterus senegalus]|nr:transcription factor RelB isoform X1 [Polypterus senegalus]